MKRYNSKVFYHRDELVEFLNKNSSYVVVDIVWIEAYFVLFYYYE